MSATLVHSDGGREGLYVSSPGSEISTTTFVSTKSSRFKIFGMKNKMYTDCRSFSPFLQIQGFSTAPCSGSTVTPDLLGANPTETHLDHRLYILKNHMQSVLCGGFPQDWGVQIPSCSQKSELWGLCRKCGQQQFTTISQILKTWIYSFVHCHSYGKCSWKGKYDSGTKDNTITKVMLPQHPKLLYSAPNTQPE